MSGWAVWFVGLPGSGKSSISKRAYEYLRDKGMDVVYLQMDERRKKYFLIQSTRLKKGARRMNSLPWKGLIWLQKGMGLFWMALRLRWRCVIWPEKR